MDYRRITLDDKKLVDSYAMRFPVLGSTYSFAYLSSWSYFDFGHMDIAYDDESLVLRFFDREKGSNSYLAELSSKEHFPSVVKEIFSDDPTASIVQLSSEYVSLLGSDEYDIKSYPDYDEYVYATKDIVTLEGKRYHSKRNFIKRFFAKYPQYIFRDYEERDRARVIALFEEWQEEKGTEIASERCAILNMLDNMQALGLMASVIEVDDKMIAFTIGEVTPSRVGIIHIEKADANYDGIYPVINNLFAREHLATTLYINRQEDLGIEGLRKAKRSYYPVRMSEKCEVRLKDN